MPDAIEASLHPYYRAVIDAYVAAERPYFHQVTPEEARAMLKAGMEAAPEPPDLPALAAVVDEVVAGPHGDIPIRRYTPLGEVVGQCVYMHSGGWVIGDRDFADATCRRLAAGAGCEVINVEYRLAPEHPFPEPLDDVYAVLSWAASRPLGPVVIAGESSGGNLAAACAIKARDAGGPAIAGQFLAYPVTDCNFETGSYREIGSRNWLLSTADMQWFWNHYCPPNVNREDPLVSPLRVIDAANLPPALICVADLDPLRDEGLAYVEHLAGAGVAVQSRRDAGMLHGYLSAAGTVDLATEAVTEASAWIRDRISAAR